MKSRVMGVDIVRCLAILFVISVHFFLYIGFYDLPLTTFTHFFLLLFRQLFFTCVPLFLILTGYLNGKQKFNRNYVYKILKILVSYCLIAVICLLCRKYFFHEDISKLQAISSIFNFSAAPYGWYVEMYVGLFFFIPFLNLAYDNIKVRSHKIALLLILVFFTAFPSLINSVYVNKVPLDIFPDYWTFIYPITYYFLGRYFKEYPLKITDLKKIILLIGTLVIQTLGCFIYCYNKPFDWSFLGGYNGLFTVIATSLILSIFANKNIRNKIGSKIVSIISLVSFEMYLISYVFDRFIYSHTLAFESSWGYLINYLMCVSFVMIASFICAFIVNKVSKFLVMKFRPYYDRFCKNIVKKAQSLNVV